MPADKLIEKKAGPPMAVCVRLRVPLVAPPTACTPPCVQANRCAVYLWAYAAMPPIAVPDTVTVPPVAELPKTAAP